MRASLKQAVVNKINSVELGEQQLAKLAGLESMPVSESNHTQGRRSVTRRQVMAAAIVLCMVALLANTAYQGYRANQLVDRISYEAVKNHRVSKPLEIRSDQLAEVLSYFDKLEFQPVVSANVTMNHGDKLLGGRYCSIQGADAAQIRVQSEGGGLRSWYQGTLPQTKLNLLPDVSKGEKPAVRFFKGLKTSVWKEFGVVFVEIGA